MDYIENRTFNEIQVGDTATLVKTLKAEDIQLFAVMSGDINPAHLDPIYASSSIFHEVIAHGMWGGALISTVLGTQYPGPGTIYINQTLHFARPVHIGDVITVVVNVIEKNERNHHVILECTCKNQSNLVVISGTAEVLAPAEKIKRPRIELPEVQLIDRHARYRQLMALTEGLEPIRMGVVHPCDKESFKGAIDAAQAGLLLPVFIAPRAKLDLIAQELQIDLNQYECIDVPHSHAAAAQAVALAGEGKLDALMKGSLHTDELMGEVVKKTSGLRTARRLSHVFLMDVPRYPKPLFITDAAINIAPTLLDKRDIIQNAIDLAHIMGIELPKVAILSAVETINEKLGSTLDAAALCKMADRGQITGAKLDGPLAFDNAVSVAAAQIKGIHSEVAGAADIIVMPDLESGNLLAKELQYLADAQAAGIVLGARVPIVLTSRADNAHTRTASCALALLLARK
jgi:phosphate acetyltransferase